MKYLHDLNIHLLLVPDMSPDKEEKEEKNTSHKAQQKFYKGCSLLNSSENLCKKFNWFSIW